MTLAKFVSKPVKAIPTLPKPRGFNKLIPAVLSETKNKFVEVVKNKLSCWKNFATSLLMISEGAVEFGLAGRITGRG